MSALHCVEAVRVSQSAVRTLQHYSLERPRRSLEVWQPRGRQLNIFASQFQTALKTKGVSTLNDGVGPF